MLVEFFLVFFVMVALLLYALVPWERGAGFRTMKYLRELPGPKSNPVFGAGFDIVKTKPHELLDFLINLSNEHPRLCKFWVACLPFVIVSQPEDLEVIMGSVHHIEKGLEYNSLLPWLNEGLLVSSGNKWHSRRKLLTPTFHFKILQDNLSSLNKHSRRLVRNFLNDKNDAIEVEKYITLCTLDVICDTAMGIQLNSQENEGSEYVETVKTVSSMVVKRLLRFWLFRHAIFNLSSLGREFQKHLKILHDFTEKIIYERKHQFATEKSVSDEDDGFGKKRKAFLDSMIEMDLKHPNTWTVKDIREEVDTFMFEGHDTTSAALIFGMYLLGHHQDIQEKAYQEQYSIFGDCDREVTKQDLNEMTYLERVIKEILRLYPSVPYLSRMLSTDAVLNDGVIIPKGTNVIIIPYGVHRSQRFYKNPEIFDPERFLPEECSKRHPYSYIPFSAGPRNCIGQKFAMMELKMIFSNLIRFSKLKTLTKPEDVRLVPFLILRTLDPIKVNIIPRSNSQMLF